MAVFKSAVSVVDAADREIGRGNAYVHLPRGREAAQEAGGTVSLQHWEPSGDDPAALMLEDGQRLAIGVTRSALSDCSRKHILRFTATWPP